MKIELKVQIFCEKCKTTILTTAANIDGVNSISLDASKGVLTITGTADAVEMVRKLRKAKISAEIISFGPEKKEKNKEKEEKKIECKQPYWYGFPQYHVYYEQYPKSNCTIF
ncbi:Heavy-metal-associated domain-containing protein [Carex littledalei]|uniref:Heavy-metal-associated domain-containing protein n=1 Tax=Carex littledalei TaxID=544730 RepID=A0A833VWU8_9POAL|nr:Heavy-metal-associated domain-containing protein [Carex littledalei]